LKFEQFPSEVIHQAKRLTIDALGCAVGGFTSEPSTIARQVALETAGPWRATVLATGHKTYPDLAAFANGTMIRYLDYNDTYIYKDTCHPSDNIAAILAAAEAAGADGKALITGIVLAYEIESHLCDTGSIRGKGWDQGTYGVLSSALGAGKVMGLSAIEMAHALSIACASSISLLQTRSGTLSMWKGCAVPNAARQAVFSALLAQRGMTGPDPVFEGTYGFFKVVSGRPFELGPWGGNANQPFKIMLSRIKPFPTGYYSQTAIEGAIKIRQELRSGDEIEEVKIHTFDQGAKIMAGDPEKWDPKTRETADHSLPYVVTVALTYGNVSLEHFSEEAIRHPAVLELVRKVKVDASDECEKAWPEATLNILEVTLKGGAKHSVRVTHHKGHPQNPMNDQEVEQKFRRLSREILAPGQADAILTQLWNLEKQKDLGRLIEMFTVKHIGP
jgi:2-methylcitrate dehydratase